MRLLCTYRPAGALRCRYASRALAGNFPNQRFWASRFEPGGEFSFLFEVQPVTKSSRNWLWIHHCVRDTSIPDVLRNREKVWQWNRILQDILSLEWSGGRTIKHWTTEKFKESNTSTMCWDEVSEITDYYYFCCWRSQLRLCHLQCTSIPAPPIKVSVTIVSDGMAT